MKKLIIFAVLFLVGCTNSKDAYKALDDSGFSNIEITGYGWFACSKDDFYQTAFSATNINGKKVTGTVCSGLIFKNSTIRFD